MIFCFSFTDLQLAAELGKTLLERNKELENLLRSNQRKCEDQKQEIEVSIAPQLSFNLRPNLPQSGSPLIP